MSVEPERGAVEDDSLVEAEYHPGSYPASRRKQITLGTAAVLLIVSLFLPWWRTEPSLSKLGETFNAWQLLLMGVGWSSYGNLSDYTWVGNALFGLAPVLPLIALIVLLVLRVGQFFVLPGSMLFLYSLLALIGAGWTFLFGVLRLDASNGVFPVLVAPWIVLLTCLGLCIVLLAWWPAERAHFPRRKWFGMGPVVVTGKVEPVSAEELFHDIPMSDVEDELIDLDDSVDGTTGGGRSR